MEPLSQQFNVVVVPTSDPASGTQTYILSAMRHDRGLRMISPDWTEDQVRESFALADISPGQVENLLRGNRMANGGRDTRYLRFSSEQLRRMGLAPEQLAAKTVVSEDDILAL